jgi:hypothetical protein
VKLRKKKLEIAKNVKTVKKPIETKPENHKIEINLSKDRAMHRRDNPSF